jgi:hypothetical protein
MPVREDKLQRDFSAAEFARLTPRQRMGKCRSMAAEAQEPATQGSDELRAAYTHLAEQWLVLADAIAHEAAHKA